MRAALLLICFCLIAESACAELPWIQVSQDKYGFVSAGTQQRFVPWGVNYDHDETGRLLEDYWDSEWEKIEADFQEIKELGANVVRIHLQFGKFMDAADKPNAHALEQVAKLVNLAEKTELYLDLTGLACYHKKDVPAWYDQLDEAARWQAQAVFWEAVAKQGANSPAIFCYDLMNEPVVPAGKTKGQDWLGPAFGGKHFVQWISLEQKDRPRHEIARQWIHQLVASIRRHDQKHLVTVGLVDWSLERPGLQSGFVPDKIKDDLDFLAVHLYPESGKSQEALLTLQGFAVGKPLIIEETFPLKCSIKELEEFVIASKAHAAGHISFYWGKKAEEYKSTSLGDVITSEWLKKFQAMASKVKQ